MNIVVADYAGGYAGSGLRYGSNAREFSLAGALIADKTSGFQAFSNPALLQFTRSNQVGFSFQNMSLDRSIKSFSFAKRLPPNAGVGLALLQSGTDNIQGKNSMNQDTELFSSSEIEGIISFGVGLGSKFALGINIKALFTTIYEDYKGNGISGDIGFIYKFNRRLFIGGIIKNLNASYNWKVIIGEDERSYEENFPLEYSMGLAYSGIKGVSLFIQEDIMITPNDDVNYRTRIGSEYKLKNKIKLRGGLTQSYGAVSEGTKIDGINLKPTFGIGAPLKVWQRQYIQLDYALDPGSVGEGLSQLFSFSLKF
jgi:hypothetical protein